jgi:hypothetical protein
LDQFHKTSPVCFCIIRAFAYIIFIYLFMDWFLRSNSGDICIATLTGLVRSFMKTGTLSCRKPTGQMN